MVNVRYGIRAHRWPHRRFTRCTDQRPAEDPGEAEKRHRVQHGLAPRRGEQRHPGQHRQEPRRREDYMGHPDRRVLAHPELAGTVHVGREEDERFGAHSRDEEQNTTDQSTNEASLPCCGAPCHSATTSSPLITPRVAKLRLIIPPEGPTARSFSASLTTL